MHEFLSLWSSGVFRDDPPNAALVRGDEVVSVELLGAVYEPATDELWFAIDPLEPTPGDAAKRLADLVGPPAGPAQLFIDGFPSPVDTQVTDAVTQTNVKVVGEAPAQSLGLVYQSMAQSMNLDPPTTMAQLDEQTTDQAAEAIAGLKST
jgi:hypothetical protein